ncbi:MAG: 50S ribosomal protein L16 [Deltaproteobacteria bacterium]|nr:50S ribosomal protein L16 [Deltaproteobacteria bacterium]
MLSPKKTKYRKQMKQVRHLKGTETRGTSLEFGDYGLKVIEAGWITNRQLEAGRQALTRHAKRGGKIWTKVFPDKPLTKKPAETRMGSGKGNVELWVCEVRAGRILFEMTGITPDVAEGALLRAASKLPLKTKIVKRSEFLL